MRYCPLRCLHHFKHEHNDLVPVVAPRHRHSPNFVSTHTAYHLVTHTSAFHALFCISFTLVCMLVYCQIASMREHSHLFLCLLAVDRAYSITMYACTHAPTHKSDVLRGTSSVAGWWLSLGKAGFLPSNHETARGRFIVPKPLTGYCT